MTNRRPEDHESHDYFKLYINQVSGDDFLQTLKEVHHNSIEFYKKIPVEKWDYRYDEGKWSIKEVLIHILDTERIFAYRALRIARNDKTPLQGFEQDDYVPFYNVENRSITSLLDEFDALRRSTIAMFQNFDDAMLERMGTASEHPVSVRALAYMIAGHEIHHLRILRERYL